MQHVAIIDAFEFGWHKMRQHSSLMFQIFLTFFALQVVKAIVERVLADTIIGFFASVALFGVSVVLGAGFIAIQLKLVHGHAAHYRDIIASRHVVWRYFLVGLVVGLLAAAGIVTAILALMPWFGGMSLAAVSLPRLIIAAAGVFFAGYVMITFMFAGFSAVEGAGLREALRQSDKITRGKKFDLFILVLACVGINIIGAMLFLVGLLVTGPVSALTVTHVYHKLKTHQ